MGTNILERVLQSPRFTIIGAKGGQEGNERSAAERTVIEGRLGMRMTEPPARSRDAGAAAGFWGLACCKSPIIESEAGLVWRNPYYDRCPGRFND